MTLSPRFCQDETPFLSHLARFCFSFSLSQLSPGRIFRLCALFLVQTTKETQARLHAVIQTIARAAPLLLGRVLRQLSERACFGRRRARSAQEVARTQLTRPSARAQRPRAPRGPPAQLRDGRLFRARPNDVARTCVASGNQCAAT